jgi:hypothetical protein
MKRQGVRVVPVLLLDGGRILEAAGRTTGPGACENLRMFGKAVAGTER